MDWSKLIEGIKLSPKYLVPIAIVTGVLLFLSTNILGFNVSPYRLYIGIIFLLSSALSLSSLIIGICKKIMDCVREKINMHEMHNNLHNLTTEEKFILLGFILEDKKTQSLDISSGVVRGLVMNHIIFRSTDYGNFVYGWHHNIDPWAWKYLKKNQNLIFSQDDINNYLAQKQKL